MKSLAYLAIPPVVFGSQLAVGAIFLQYASGAARGRGVALGWGAAAALLAAAHSRYIVRVAPFASTYATARFCAGALPFVVVWVVAGTTDTCARSCSLESWHKHFAFMLAALGSLVVASAPPRATAPDDPNDGTAAAVGAASGRLGWVLLVLLTSVTISPGAASWERSTVSFFLRDDSSRDDGCCPPPPLLSLVS